MRFALSEEQLSLRDAARAFLADLPGPHTMAEVGANHAPGTWSRIVEEQGWPAILIPPDAGGWGYGLVELAVVFEEAGRALVPSPLLGTVGLATTALLVNASPIQQTRWLERIATGTTATLALDGDVTATRAPKGWTLSGTARRVVDGASAELIVFATDAGLFVVEGTDAHRAPLPCLDPTRPLADVRLDGLTVTDRQRLEGSDLDAALDRARVLLAAEQTGAADACLALVVDYAKVRQQFGRSIGSFQAVQHTCADMLVAVEMARSATWYAAWALDAGAPDAALAARTARALAGDAAFACAAGCVQLHGGIGFTWEHPAHLYLKRARASFALLGDPAAQRASIANALLDTADEAAWI